jgi:hypothetical protein
MRLIYLAHPVAGSVLENVACGRRWLLWAYHEMPADVVIAPWITDIEVLPLRDEHRDDREIGLVRCETVIAHCDAMILVGGRISSGMKREAQWAESLLIPVYDFTNLGPEPPADGAGDPRVASASRLAP